MSLITSAYREAFQLAAKRVRAADDSHADVRFHSRLSYSPFLLGEDCSCVRRALSAARAIGLEPRCVRSNGGSDANWLVAHGVPTITFGAGEHNIHTLAEYVEVREFLLGCRLGLELAVS